MFLSTATLSVSTRNVKKIEICRYLSVEVWKGSQVTAIWTAVLLTMPNIQSWNTLDGVNQQCLTQIIKNLWLSYSCLWYNLNCPKCDHSRIWAICVETFFFSRLRRIVFRYENLYCSSYKFVCSISPWVSSVHVRSPCLMTWNKTCYRSPNRSR